MPEKTKNVAIREELHEQLKRIAKEKRNTIKVLTEDGVEWVVSNHPPKAKETTR